MSLQHRIRQIHSPDLIGGVSPRGSGLWLGCLRESKVNSPKPSLIPRNFKDEPAIWYDEALTTSETDFTHDHELVVRFTTSGELPDTTTRFVFGNNSNRSLWNIEYYVNGQIQVNCGIFSRTEDPTRTAYQYIRGGRETTNHPPLTAGEHVVRIRAVGDTMYAKLDDEEEYSAPGLVRWSDPTVLEGNPPQSQHDGSILEITHTDLTTKKLIWAYPSEAERVRLITKTNIRTDRSTFEAANADQMASVVTQFDLRKNVTSKTFFARGYFPKHADNGSVYIHPLIGQGGVASGAGSWVFALSVWEDYRASNSHVRGGFTRQSENDVQVTVFVITDDFFDKEHDVAYVVDYDTPAQITTSLYLDGNLVKREQKPYGIFGEGTANALSVNAGIRQDVIVNYRAGTLVDFVFVFDYALSSSEIVALMR